MSRTAFQKLQAATGSANVSVSWEDFDSAISFRQFGAYLLDATVFSELAKAIQNKELVEFGYKKLDAKVFEKRTVEPWHLACISGQWYLLGHDRRRNARRIFVLARMQKVSRTGQKFSNSRPGRGTFNVSSGTVFKSGKAKMPSSDKSSCDFPAGPRSSFVSGIGIRASRSRS
jgi:predicted DNA-binding transcriptional regulator YafY